MYERYRVFRVNTNPYLCDVVKCLWPEVTALRTFGLIFITKMSHIISLSITANRLRFDSLN